jgi:hypothetical protein
MLPLSITMRCMPSIAIVANICCRYRAICRLASGASCSEVRASIDARWEQCPSSQTTLVDICCQVNQRRVRAMTDAWCRAKGSCQLRTKIAPGRPAPHEVACRLRAAACDCSWRSCACRARSSASKTRPATSRLDTLKGRSAPTIIVSAPGDVRSNRHSALWPLRRSDSGNYYRY